MKWFLLIIMAAAAGAIFYFRDEITGKIAEATSSADEQKNEEIVVTGDGSTATKTTSKPSVTKNGTGTRTTPKKPPTEPVKPHADEGEDDEIAKRYPMPKFKSIDQAVGNWQAIPPSAFPRQITISKPVKIVLAGGIGSTTIPANTSVFALDSRGGILTVGRRKDDAKARGQIAIDDTNFKQILGKEFDRWKTNQQEIVMKKRARHRNVLRQTDATASQGPSRNERGLLQYEKELGKKPAQNSDGTVPLMLASLKRKDVSEITPGIIRNWGPVIREEVDGEAYWTATVEYETVSMFGEINTEAQALMRNGKVMQWIYTGSGESVP